MTTTACVIVGGGQAGLAASRCLVERGIEHVVLERGRVGERWRSERWDSLRLLTPNWQSRLPGFAYDGPDPDGFMTMPEVVGYLERYASSFGAPVCEGVTVTSVTRAGGGFLVVTSAGEWMARAVIVATGYSDVPHVPAVAAGCPTWLTHLVPTAYRRPTLLPEGGVLVVGASATGIQLADEIHRSGRPVTLAVGHHTRLPRRYRGRDVLWWLDRMGVFDETIDDVYDLAISREQPSLQLIGHPDHLTINLRTLASRGVRVTGRLRSVDGTVARFEDDLVATTAAADIKLAMLQRRIDQFIAREAITAEATPEFEPHCLGFAGAPMAVDLAREGIRTVVWATGFTRRYPWLRVPVLDDCGQITQARGVTPEPGLYTVGLHFQTRRNSSFIDGVGHDAREVAAHLAAFLARRPTAVA